MHLSDELASAGECPCACTCPVRVTHSDLVQTRILLESWAIARIDPKTVSSRRWTRSWSRWKTSTGRFVTSWSLLTFHHQVMRCGGNELLVGLLASVRQPSFESMLPLVGRARCGERC